MISEKVCILTGIYPPDTGGPATFAQNFSDFLKSLGYEITILTYTNEKTKVTISENINVHAVSRKLPVIVRYLLMIRLINRYSKNGYALLANGCFLEVGFWSFLSNKRYSVKIPGDIVWERARNVGLTDLDVESFQETKLPFRYRIFKYFFWKTIVNADHVIAPSKQLGTLCVRNGTTTQKIKIVHNSVFIPSNTGPSVISKDTDFVCVSRLVNWKGIGDLIRAISHLDASLVLVGDGPERVSLEKLASELGAKVEFAGEVTPTEVKKFLLRSKYFVLNSKFEATSYAMLEAMSYGLIPIGNSNTGSEEIIKHLENGLIVGESTGIELEDALFLLLQNSLNNATMSLRAAETVQSTYNAQKNFRRILEIIES